MLDDCFIVNNIDILDHSFVVKQESNKRYTMLAGTPSFTPLPDFTFLPDSEGVQLGTILPYNKQTKQPDPRRPLNKQSRVTIDKVSEQTTRPWKWDSETQNSLHAGVNLDISLVTGIGAGIGGGYGCTKSLKIDCEHLETKTFLADPQYIARAVADEFIQKLLKKTLRPPVYLITGIMIAYKAKITTETRKTNDGNIHAAADATQSGVPLNVNAELKGENSENVIWTQSPEKPFVLAYQLVRIRRKFLGDVDSKDENAAALFNDDVVEGGDAATKLLVDYDIDAADAKTIAEDESQQ